MQSTPEYSVALAAAEAGGAILRQYFGQALELRSKAVADLVTDADINAERAIVDIIHKAFPQHAVLGEESNQADMDSEHLWVVDPLDGTTNFAHQIPHFAVSVAYYRAGRPQCGIVFNPLRDDWYGAILGQGAEHNGRPIRVAPIDRLDQSLIGVGFYYDRGAMMEATLAAIGDLFRTNIHGIRRFGTASLDLAHVACGYYSAYFEYELKPWDYAAGRLLVEEAGGRVTTCRGEDLPLARTNLLASNGLLHNSVMAIVEKHLLHGQSHD